MSAFNKKKGRVPRAQRVLRACSHKGTWWLGKRFPEMAPLVYVVGYPKSGTTWVCQLLADYLQMPFPRGSLLPVAFPAVVHGHETVRPCDQHAAYVVRDGRDVMSSLYFHLTRHIPEGDRPRLSKREKKMFPGLVNKADVQTNFPRFLEQQMRDPFASKFHWGAHVERSLAQKRDGVAVVRYDQLLADGPGELTRTIEAITGEEADPERVGWTIEKFSFARQSGRKAGKENRTSFLRKGTTGDWRNHFSRASAEIFDRYCGEALIAAGYEQDRLWVQGVPAGGGGGATA